MKYSELSAKSAAELQKEIKEKRLQLFTLRMKLKTMQLSNTSEIRAVRKDIARMMTALSAKGE
ncbi:MAG: 50S ribosomal protein L29 [Campylobacterales bacterium]